MSRTRCLKVPQFPFLTYRPTMKYLLHITIIFRKDILFNGVDFSFISQVKTLLLHDCSFLFTSYGSKNIYWYKAARACFRIVIVISQC